MVGQRHVARHRHVAPADQPRIREGVVGRATRAGRDQRRAVAGEARDAVDTRGLNGLGEGHRRQDGGEPPGQHRLARPWGTQEEDVMGRTPASRSPWHVPLDMVIDMTPPDAAPCRTLFMSTAPRRSRARHLGRCAMACVGPLASQVGHSRTGDKCAARQRHRTARSLPSALFRYRRRAS